MNITLNPQITTNYNITNFSKPNYNINFKAKTPNAKQAKQSLNIAQKMYDTFFVPKGDKLKEIKDGFAYTEALNESTSTKTSKKFKLWSRTPDVTIEDNLRTKLRVKTSANPNGTKDVEVFDTHTPEYPVGIKYSNINKAGIDDGTLKLKFGDKKTSIQKKERESMKEALKTELDDEYSNAYEITKSMDTKQAIEYINSYFCHPKKIALSILDSAECAQEQGSTIKGSIPYGVEYIINRLDK